MSHKDRITAQDLPVSLSIRRVKSSDRSVSLTSNVEEVERSNIIDALDKTGWVQARAAKFLGITPRQIGYKIKKYNLVQDELV